MYFRGRRKFMKAINDHIYATKLCFDLLMKGKYWLYLLPSFIISLIFVSIYTLFSSIFSFLDYANDVPLVGSYLGTGVSAITSVFAYAGELFYQFFILTILSPVYCLLSEKVDNNVAGSKFDGGIVRIMTDLIRAVFIVIVALFLNLIFICLWWLFAWFTGFHLLDEIMYFLIGAFFIGFSFYDFSLERYEIGTFGSWGFGFKNMSYMFITGGLFSLFFKVPYFGVLLSPFLLTIISTIVFLKMHNKIPSISNNSTSSNE
jgi:CysZ protein